MKKLISAFVASIALMGTTNSMAVTNDNGEDWLKKSTKTAVYQLTKAAQTFTPGMNPRSINNNGTVRLAPPRDWTT